MLLAALTGPAHALTSDWAVNEGGRMRLIVLPADGSGKRGALLQIEPDSGWVTYWREPGDSGIAPQIAAEPGSPYTLSPLSFPVPRRLVDGDIKDIGYTGPVSLPLSIAGPASGELRATAFIGLCRNICVPFQADFAVSLRPDDSIGTEEAAIAFATEATLPDPPSADFDVTATAWDADLKHLDITLTLPPGFSGAPELFLTGPNGYVFTDFAGRAAGAGRYQARFPIEKLPRGYDIHGKRWQILAVAGDRAIEKPLDFE